MVTIHADLDAGQERIVLLAGGQAPAEELAMFAKRLEVLTPLFSRSDPPGALTVPATWPAVVQLAEAFGPDWHPHERLSDWIAEQVRTRTAAAGTGGGQPLGYTPPKGLTPYPWQVEGAALIAATGRALIFDEPRTGKTITAVMGLVEYASTTLNAGPAIVVCPASVVDPWVEAWQTWAPHVKAVAWRGPKRDALLGTADVYVTSYETARMDAPVGGTKAMRPLIELKAHHLVVDECHLIKNNQAARSQAVRRLARIAVNNRGAVVALSGTPITHHPGDLWPALACLEPDAYPARGRWVSRYCQTTPGEGYEETILGLHPAMEPEFRLTVLGQHRRVARADVWSQLPPKVYSVRTVDLSPHWRKAYDDFETQMLAELPDDGGELSVMDTLSVLSHLSALSCAPADVEITYGPDVDEQTGEPKRHVHLELKASSWKVDALLEILEERCGPELPGGGEKVVAFAESAQLMRLAGAAAAAAGYRVGYIIGGQSQKARTETRLAFQGGKLDLVCATTGAGGTGITLSAAGTLVFLQRPWALVESMQAEDRAEGDLNATRGTEIIDVVARDTVDSRRRAVLRERAGQLADLLQDPRIVAELLGGRSVTETSVREAERVAS